MDMGLMTLSILVEQEGFQEFHLKSRTVTDDYVIFDLFNVKKCATMPITYCQRTRWCLRVAYFELL